MTNRTDTASVPEVVIVGAGFGGLQAAKKLSKLPLQVTLIDRNNHHTFQPFLYQVATTLLSPAQIATPLRTIFRNNKNVEVVLGEVTEMDIQRRRVVASGVEFKYDYLIVAAGARHSYFGHEEWEPNAPGLKTIDDALRLRRRILLALEEAERESIALRRNPATGSRADRVNFVVVGAGPTGVEVAGMLATLTRQIIEDDFRAIDTTKIRVVLVDAGERVLRSFAEDVSQSAEQQLRDLGVELRLSRRVSDVGEKFICIGDETIPSAVTIWATGVAASGLGRFLSKELDRSGRVPVGSDLSLPGHPEVFVIGDMAASKAPNGSILPGLASVAQQQGAAVAHYVSCDLQGKFRKPFAYSDRGTMATIGRRAAVAEWRGIHLSRTLAWLLWAMVHAMLLVDFRTRSSVLREWAWSLLTRKTPAALITGAQVSS